MLFFFLSVYITQHYFVCILYQLQLNNYFIIYVIYQLLIFVFQIIEYYMLVSSKDNYFVRSIE